jgi:hypothetical protein
VATTSSRERKLLEGDGLMSAVVDAEFRNLIPPLQRQERIGLEASLRSEGCRDALAQW